MLLLSESCCVYSLKSAFYWNLPNILMPVQVQSGKMFFHFVLLVKLKSCVYWWKQTSSAQVSLFSLKNKTLLGTFPCGKGVAKGLILAWCARGESRTPTSTLTMNQTKYFLLLLTTGLAPDPRSPDIILVFGKYLNSDETWFYWLHINLGLQPVTYNCETLKKIQLQMSTI